MFALVNLPEVVKGALFARYSRSPKSLRRLFLDEFLGPGRPRGRGRRRRGPRRRRHAAGRAALRARVRRVRRRLGGPARRRAPGLRGRVEHPDQGAGVGPAHGLPRAVDPLHPLRRPSRRPVPLPRPRRADRRRSASATSRRSIEPSTPTAVACRSCARSSRRRFPRDPAESETVYRMTIRAKALDTLRGMLPAATTSNVGIYGTGQAYEQLLLRMRAHPLQRGAGLRRSDAGRAAQGHPRVSQARGPPRARRGRGRRTSTRPAGDTGESPAACSSAGTLRRRGDGARATRTRSC